MSKSSFCFIVEFAEIFQIKVWKDGTTFYGRLNTADPIKDMAVSNHLIFTVKDLDLVITDVRVAGTFMHTINNKFFRPGAKKVYILLLNSYLFTNPQLQENLYL